jgi:hypothetical protein
MFNFREVFIEIVFIVFKVALTFFWWNGETNEKINEYLKIGNNATVPLWTKKCREIAVQMCIVLSEPIGGLGMVVEIDESMFGKSKIQQHASTLVPSFFL